MCQWRNSKKKKERLKENGGQMKLCEKLKLGDYLLIMFKKLSTFKVRVYSLCSGQF